MNSNIDPSEQIHTGSSSNDASISGANLTATQASKSSGVVPTHVQQQQQHQYQNQSQHYSQQQQQQPQPQQQYHSHQQSPNYGVSSQPYTNPNNQRLNYQGYNGGSNYNQHHHSPFSNPNQPYGVNQGSVGSRVSETLNNSPFFVNLLHYSELIDQFLGKIGAPIKPWLPAIGRFFIVATFFEDGYRIFSQWNAQVHYIWKYRGIPHFLTVFYLAINVMSMYTGSLLVVSHKNLIYGVGALIFVVVSQALVYGLVFNFQFFFRNLSIIGGLLMVLSDAFIRDRRALNLPGLPLAEVKDRARYFQLTGRILLILLFVSYLISGNFSLSSFVGVLSAVSGLVACTLVTIGYKARLSASFLVAVLTWRNLTSNMYWTIESGNPIRDFLRYEHFQVLSIIGGLLLVINSGPGAISVDEKKKNH